MLLTAETSLQAPLHMFLPLQMSLLWPFLSGITASQHLTNFFLGGVSFFQAITVWMKMNKKGMSWGSQSQCLPEFSWVLFFITFHLFSVCMYQLQCVYGGQRTTLGVCTGLPLCGSQGSNSGYQVGGKGPLSHLPSPSVSVWITIATKKDGAQSSRDPVWMSSKGHWALFGWPQGNEKKAFGKRCDAVRGMH